METLQSPRGITFNELCAILLDAARPTAPVVEQIGHALHEIGDQANSPVLAAGGAWAANVARLTIQVMTLMQSEDAIHILPEDPTPDARGGLHLERQAMLAMQRIRNHARRRP